MLSDQDVLQYAPLTRELEATEPVLCSWRVEATRHPPTVRRASLRWAARTLRGAVSNLKRLERPAPDQVVALTTAMTPATIGTLRPVLAELARRNRHAFLVTQPSTRSLLSENLHRGHVDILELAALAGLPWRCKALRRAETLATELGQVLPTDSVRGAAQWIELGMAVREGVRRWLGTAACVIADSDSAAYRKGFIVGAQQAGVPGYVLQHGFLGSHHFPLHARSLLCWGEYFRRQAAAYGLSPERMLAVGNPRWDVLTQMRAESSASAARKQTEGSPPRPTVLVLSQTQGAATQPELFRAFFGSVKNLIEAGVQVTIKLHPAEIDARGYRGNLPAEIVDRLSVLPPAASLHEAILKADVVYNVSSAASLEAMLLGLPVLFEQGPKAGMGLFPFPEEGGGVWCAPGTIVSVVTGLAAPGAERSKALEAQEMFLDDMLTNRGHATSVVVDLLLDRAN